MTGVTASTLGRGSPCGRWEPAVRSQLRRVLRRGPPPARVSAPHAIPALQPPKKIAEANETGLTGRDFGALDRTQYQQFVRFFRQASPYIEGHRGRTFVISIPGEALSKDAQLSALVEDIALLHGLGVHLVLVLGSHRGPSPGVASPYPVTPPHELEGMIQDAGLARLQVEALLSRVPTAALARRHTSPGGGGHGEDGGALPCGPVPLPSPGLSVVSGNYVTAKRRGVIGGVDHGATGIVRGVNARAVAAQLTADSVVLLSAVGFSAGGEALACNPSAVAAMAAVVLRADKLIFLTPGPVVSVGAESSASLAGWLPLNVAEAALLRTLGTETQRAALLRDLAEGGGVPPDDEDQAGGGQTASPPRGAQDNGASWRAAVPAQQQHHYPYRRGGDGADGLASQHAAAAAGPAPAGAGPGTAPTAALLPVDLEAWAARGVPLALLTACAACRAGVPRVHLVDAGADGGLLRELYSPDGCGSMVSADLYDGIRGAAARDLGSIAALLRPLEQRGFLVPRSRERLAADLPTFIVWEREGRVLGCVAAPRLAPDIAELAAFAVHPDYRGLGKGDSLLEVLEARARADGVRTVVLLTTRTADWFQQRGFVHVGNAAGNPLLPEARRTAIDPARNSQLYAKHLGPFN